MFRGMFPSPLYGFWGRTAMLNLHDVQINPRFHAHVIFHSMCVITVRFMTLKKQWFLMVYPHQSYPGRLDGELGHLPDELCQHCPDATEFAWHFHHHELLPLRGPSVSQNQTEIHTGYPPHSPAISYKLGMCPSFQTHPFASIIIVSSYVLFFISVTGIFLRLRRTWITSNL